MRIASITDPIKYGTDALNGRKKGECLMVFKRELTGFFYNCEYLKDCDKVTPQCREGEIVTVVNIEKEANKKTLSVCLNKFHC
jgi:hypothetical protein